MRLPITAALIPAATPALAHHPLSGLPMETFADGLFLALERIKAPLVAALAG